MPRARVRTARLDCDDHDPTTSDTCDLFEGCRHLRPCAGDCNLSGRIEGIEVYDLVQANLGSVVGFCPSGDRDASGMITVEEIVTAVGNRLNVCPGAGVVGR